MSVPWNLHDIILTLIFDVTSFNHKHDWGQPWNVEHRMSMHTKCPLGPSTMFVFATRKCHNGVDAMPLLCCSMDWIDCSDLIVLEEMPDIEGSELLKNWFIEEHWESCFHSGCGQFKICVCSYHLRSNLLSSIASFILVWLHLPTHHKLEKVNCWKLKCVGSTSRVISIHFLASTVMWKFFALLLIVEEIWEWSSSIFPSEKEISHSNSLVSQ